MQINNELNSLELGPAAAAMTGLTGLTLRNAARPVSATVLLQAREEGRPARLAAWGRSTWGVLRHAKGSLPTGTQGAPLRQRGPAVRCTPPPGRCSTSTTCLGCAAWMPTFGAAASCLHSPG